MAYSIQSLRDRAKKRVPRIFFDYADGGALHETAVERNRLALDAVRLWPRGPRDVSVCDSSVEIFGERLSMPLGVAPIGLANLIWPGTDISLARSAADCGIPYVLSTSSSTLIEDIGKEAGPLRWFQLYVSKDSSINKDLLRRASEAGFSVLVVSTDVPAPGRRYRDLANGFKLPMAMGPSFLAQILRCPAWARAMLKSRAPSIVNLKKYTSLEGSQSLAAFMAAQISSAVDLSVISELRSLWSGPLVVKGIMHPEDAISLADCGVDGVVVSNHGGRQLASAPAAIEVLASVAEAVGHRMTVIADGGVRTGEDIARMLASGAKMVLAGRPFLWSVAATGEGHAAIDILENEFRTSLRLLGCPAARDLGPEWIVPAQTNR